MTKILHVITDLCTGGAERALYRLLSGGLQERFDNAVLSLSDEMGVFVPVIREMSIPVYSLGIRGRLPGLGSFHELRRVVTRFRPDIVQGWMYHGNLAAWLASRMTSGRAALAWSIRHCLYSIENEKRISRQVIRANRFLSGSPAVIFYNSRLSRRQHEAFGFPVSGGRVIPNGFDVEQLAPSDQKAHTVRAALGIPHDARVVGHVARLHPMKDHRTFLRAAVSVTEILDDVHVVLCGLHVGPENSGLTALAPGALRRRFHFLGERNDVPDLMCAMDVFCQSSWSEAFPNVLGEAMATGIPCLATDVGDSADIIGDTGLVVPPRDEGAIAAGLERMLEWPPEKRKSMGRAARSRIKENYSLQKTLEQYASVYKRLGNRG